MCWNKIRPTFGASKFIRHHHTCFLIALSDLVICIVLMVIILTTLTARRHVDSFILSALSIPWALAGAVLRAMSCVFGFMAFIYGSVRHVRSFMAISILNQCLLGLLLSFMMSYKFCPRQSLLHLGNINEQAMDDCWTTEESWECPLEPMCSSPSLVTPECPECILRCSEGSYFVEEPDMTLKPLVLYTCESLENRRSSSSLSSGTNKNNITSSSSSSSSSSSTNPKDNNGHVTLMSDEDDAIVWPPTNPTTPPDDTPNPPEDKPSEDNTTISPPNVEPPDAPENTPADEPIINPPENEPIINPPEDEPSEDEPIINPPEDEPSDAPPEEPAEDEPEHEPKDEPSKAPPPDNENEPIVIPHQDVEPTDSPQKEEPTDSPEEEDSTDEPIVIPDAPRKISPEDDDEHKEDRPPFPPEDEPPINPPIGPPDRPIIIPPDLPEDWPHDKDAPHPHLINHGVVPITTRSASVDGGGSIKGGVKGKPRGKEVERIKVSVPTKITSKLSDIVHKRQSEEEAVTSRASALLIASTATKKTDGQRRREKKTTERAKQNTIIKQTREPATPAAHHSSFSWELVEPVKTYSRIASENNRDDEGKRRNEFTVYSSNDGIVREIPDSSSSTSQGGWSQGMGRGEGKGVGAISSSLEWPSAIRYLASWPNPIRHLSPMTEASPRALEIRDEYVGDDFHLKVEIYVSQAVMGLWFILWFFFLYILDQWYKNLRGECSFDVRIHNPPNTNCVETITASEMRKFSSHTLIDRKSEDR